MDNRTKQAIHRALRDPEHGETLLKLARQHLKLMDEHAGEFQPINQQIKDPLFYTREIYKQQLAYIVEQQKEIIEQYLD
jgi:hypothetical protein